MEGDSAHPHQPLQAQRRQFHPPATFPPSRDEYTLQSEFLDSQFRMLREVEQTRARGEGES